MFVSKCYGVIEGAHFFGGRCFGDPNKACDIVVI